MMKTGRPAGKTKVEDLLSVDLRVLKRTGALMDGCTSVIQWFRQDQYLGEYRVVATTDDLSINCHIQRSPEYNISEKVELTYTNCYLGGSRPWMVCPRCHRRIMILYLATAGLGCRHCLNLTYASRNEGRTDQLLRSVRNSRKKVGAATDLSTPIPPKKKWQQNKKYNRLRKKAERYEIKFLGLMDEKIKRMGSFHMNNSN